MIVTKQQQLKWLVGFTGGCYVITQEEWQQEREKMQKQQDNSWHERGEFPPVGAICEMIDDKNTWLECEVISHKDGSCIGWIPSRKAPFYTYDKSEFRPLRTEREKAIDEMVANIGNEFKFEGYDLHTRITRSLSEFIYDAGYRKVNP